MRLLPLLLLALTLTGCEDSKPQPLPTNVTSEPGRFTVERVGTIPLIESGKSTSACPHDLFILRDSKTGVNYIGVESVGLCRMEPMPGPVIQPPSTRPLNLIPGVEP